jgi:hypothetical protein
MIYFLLFELVFGKNLLNPQLISENSYDEYNINDTDESPVILKAAGGKFL